MKMRFYNFVIPEVFNPRLKELGDESDLLAISPIEAFGDDRKGFSDVLPLNPQILKMYNIHCIRLKAFYIRFYKEVLGGGVEGYDWDFIF